MDVQRQAVAKIEDLLHKSSADLPHDKPLSENCCQKLLSKTAVRADGGT
jgi:hypothetical protein